MYKSNETTNNARTTGTIPKTGLEPIEVNEFVSSSKINLSESTHRQQFQFNHQHAAMMSYHQAYQNNFLQQIILPVAAMAASAATAAALQRVHHGGSSKAIHSGNIQVVSSAAVGKKRRRRRRKRKRRGSRSEDECPIPSTNSSNIGSPKLQTS